MKKGILLALGAYLSWGVFPLYFKALQQVPATQILAHRIVWSLLFLAILLGLRREGRRFRQAVGSFRTLLVCGVAACLLGINWLTYIWAVNSGFMVDASLGYFINPLVNVLLGVLLLKERLRPAQWIPVGLATAGVLYLTFSHGSLPWIALVLAFTFGLYGLIKKTASLEAFYGLTLETASLFVPALIFLGAIGWQGKGAFGSADPRTSLLLLASGPVTALPLLMFGGAARRIPLSVLGIIQYLSPTCQFLLGVLVYGEPLAPERLLGFGLIWAALLFFTLEGLLSQRRSTHPEKGLHKQKQALVTDGEPVVICERNAQP